MRSELGVYLVTDTTLCGAYGVAATVRDAVVAGIRIVQVRDKTASSAELLALTAAVCAAVGRQARVIVNDRVDVYLHARERGLPVHGVHVGASDTPPIEARARIGPDAILGLTANTLAAIAAARALPAGTVDYLGIGVIRATATKPDHPPVIGVDGFGTLARTANVPCVAIGGIGVADVGPLRRAGAAGVAVVSAVCGRPHPAAAASALVHAWTQARA